MPVAPFSNAGGPASALAERRRVLVVDDEPINRTILGGLLRTTYDVIEAPSGEEALEVAQRLRVDVIVMDIRMPGLDGFETTAALKRAHAAHHLPVLLMTAGNDEEQLARGLAAGADDFLTKPVSPVLLRAKIAAALRVSDAFATIRDQRDQLTFFRTRASRDYAVARRIFARVAERSLRALPTLEHRAPHRDAVSSTLLLASPFAEHRLRVLLGDFAGQGLAAAVGASPLADVFHGLTEAGRGLGDLARALNDKMRTLFSEDIFLAAAIVDLRLDAGEGEIWNGGLPDGLLLDPDGHIVERFAPHHLPLGAVGPAFVTADTQAFHFPRRHSLFLGAGDLVERGGLRWSNHLVDLVEGLQGGSDFPRDLEYALRQGRSSTQTQDWSFVRVINDDLLARDVRAAHPLFERRRRPNASRREGDA
jgi:CheY-like chemotaxis protein